MKKNLLDLDLQYFADEVEDAGAEEPTVAESVEDESTESEEVETGETEEGNAEPEPQSDEENARYAAIRRRAEEEARRKFEREYSALDQQITAMCKDVTHPVTGKPITNVRDYVDALSAQQRMATQQELQEKGIDPSLIDRMIAENPVVMQAQQVIEAAQQNDANMRLQNDIAEICKYDPSMKGFDDIVALPFFPNMCEMVGQSGGKVSLLDAYKVFGFDAYMQHQSEAGRQQAINQMRGKSHLPSQSQNVASDTDDVDVPADIMANWKAEGKTEKQIKELYRTVAKKLHLN